MNDMTVTSPGDLKERLKLRADAHGFSRPENYVVDLLARDLKFTDAESRLRALDAAIAEGRADVAAGRTMDMDDVFDALEAKLAGMGARRRLC
ncbi:MULTISPECIES: hypothetical protein [unclassified Rhizobium]|uniref:hypothetical protein n=1 Tax=unclassified Rhizobium TaxID=2613769 RepID=UPI0016017CBE|nr:MULTISPECIES: hypothetical protein [unclassified Rhizobium]MBB1248633.1 hypothetical protein [Rhizobium sp. G21]MCV3766389.1 hypothetical protein [Rhizobium sp. TRM95796]